jgi:hypothetical protein
MNSRPRFQSGNRVARLLYRFLTKSFSNAVGFGNPSDGLLSVNKLTTEDIGNRGERKV